MNSLADRPPRSASPFDAEVARVRASGTLGESGRLLELFDYLAGRGPDTPSASQAEIAESVFGQTETGVDDATARVYVHRLRRRLDDFYAAEGEPKGRPRLTLPAGTYALRLAQEGGEASTVDPVARSRPGTLATVLVALFVIAAAFLVGRTLADDGDAPPANALWQPFLDSPRPTLIVVGDYYMFGEIDPVRPEEGRLIRDFRVNSPSDLIQMQDLHPERYGSAEDVGLNYLPFSVAYGLSEIAPILARDGGELRVLAASELTSDLLNRFDVVYVGLFSGMALLEEVSFTGSGFELGESYDEIIDTVARQRYTSEEARRLASPVYYRDYGYVARFRAPGGALVAVVAGARDTALRGIAPIVAAPKLPEGFADSADEAGFEALFQITGQQGADLSERLLVARARP